MRWKWTGIAVLLAGLCTGCGIGGIGIAPRTTPPLPKPVTEDGMTLVWGEDVKREALSLIHHSQRYVYLDMYELSDPDILQALVDARRAGVDVRVVVDANERASQSKGFPYLRHAGVAVQSLRIPRGISHIKMMVTDRGVLLGGMNFGTYSWHNNDASVYLAKANPSFLALFRWDWARAHGEPAQAPAAQHPLLYDRAVRRHVVQAIEAARTSIRMEAFVLSDWQVIDALVAACRRGVAVEVLLDPTQSQNRRTANRLRDAGAAVRFYRPYGDELMHAKILDVDAGRVFIIGSANFSRQAYDVNHEGDIELYDVPAFDRALTDDLTVQVGRGTDYPVRHRVFQDAG
ncbi:hypothetical protein GCM10010885_04730 [Alicyclobacillus cellulosilyticus]|uniref:phospholipase D n=1 Tax=Alicyclobacillus cellulosilyticus TaxID=1003997 RepID=A0A917K5I2_9BACL|nr:phospholipase D-like domain-containing protein [Alicyclobacillus cellulosilyticus]GGI98194.1 hypothetical protein GCM10010885_04730 [Alicyclobacillus cellulosilyticus]